MANIIIAFLTGLTTGGLSCLAGQGGLLASSVAKEIEDGYRSQKKRPGKPASATRKPGGPFPIVWFLAAKIAAYTVLGFLIDRFRVTDLPCEKRLSALPACTARIA